MDNLSLIAAIGQNNELGLNNNLIWHLPSDLKYFKKVTSGKTIIMGRRCFESLPGLLPNRTSIILTNNKDYIVDGAIIYHDIKEVLDYVKNTNDECFIIGGALIYELFIPYVKKMYLTEIASESKADVYFPKFDKNLYDREVIADGNYKGLNYSYVRYRRK